MTDELDQDLLRAVAAYLKRVASAEKSEQTSQRTPLGDVVSEHLGVDASTVAVVMESIADHRLVDADLALSELTGEDGLLVGVNGGEHRQHQGFAELVANPFARFAPGPVDYAERATGPDSTRRVVSMGIWLLWFEGTPIAVLQRTASPRTGRDSAALEVMAVDHDVTSRFLDRVRALMIERSVLRGKVLSFQPTEFGHDAGATFLPRPEVDESDIVLPPGVLDEVTTHVLGIGEHRDALRAAGQHLKRGVLLYGPPGTGKTLTIRHLITRATDTTVVLLTGNSIRFIQAATEIARTFEPSLVVLEDIDLVAMERHMTPQPLLFEVLEALDGLGGDADITFVMTTNRVEVLEQALAERPGRVDLAVEIPRPGRAEREMLLRRYASGLPISDEALAAAATTTDGVTGSFAKELVRRAVLDAASRDEPVGDEHLARALTGIMDARAQLTRRMLGTDAPTDGPGRHS
jgi:hypothetical protein